MQQAPTRERETGHAYHKLMWEVAGFSNQLSKYLGPVEWRAARLVCQAWHRGIDRNGDSWSSSHFALRLGHEYRWTLISTSPAAPDDQAISEDLINGEGQQLKTLRSPDVSNRILKRIDLSKLTDRNQSRVLQHIKGLTFTHLNLSGCATLTDKHLQGILQHCPNLLALDLSGANGIKKLTYLSKHCLRLRWLWVRGVPTLTNLSWDGWLKSGTLLLPDLQYLDISHCAALQRVALRAPKLKYLTWQGEHIPKVFELEANRLQHLAADSDAVLKTLLQFSPLTLTFKQARILPIKTFDQEQFGHLRAVHATDDRIGYHYGSTYLSDMIDRADLLGHTTFMISDGTGARQTFCFVQKLKEDANTFWQTWQRLAQETQPIHIGGKLFSRIKELDIQQISEACAQLTRLNVPRGNIPIEQLIGKVLHKRGDLLDKLVVAVVKRASLLTELRLPKFRQMEEASLRSVVANCQSLTSLDLAGWDKISDAGFTTLFESCTTLTNLNLSSSKARTNPTDQLVTTLAQNCTSLVHLKLNYCKAVTDIGLEALVKHCSELATVGVYGCSITDEGIGYLAKLSQLTSLNLGMSIGGRIKPQGLLRLVEQISGLTKLKLSGHNYIKNRDLELITQHLGELRVLSLGHCTGITEEGAYAVATKCPHLTSLDLTAIPGISDQSLAAIGQGCAHLASIRLESCDKITEKGIALLADRCKHLRSISLGYRRQPADPLVTALVQRSTHLTSIRITNCQLLSDAAIALIADNCPKLKNIDLSECRQLTDASVFALVSGCPRLVSIAFSNCPQLTEKAREALNRALGESIYPTHWSWKAYGYR